MNPETRAALAELTPVSEDLFYSRNDPNDLRFGDVVDRGLEKYERSEVVLIGCPQDIGVRRNRGREGARLAPAKIRRALYRYVLSESHQGLRMVDLGDVPVDRDLEQVHYALAGIVRVCLEDEKKVVVLGGGNDIAYPDCLALSQVVDRPLALNIDRHLDVRADATPNSGTPYRQLLEEGAIEPDRFHEVGINTFANSPTYLQYVRDRGAHLHCLADLRSDGVGETVRGIVENSDADGIFFGFDLDVVRAVEAPGVSDPSPMGLTAREVCEIADVAAQDPRTRVIEISEVNPEFDQDQITCRLAANILVRALAR